MRYYDNSVLRSYADALRQQAQTILLVDTVMGAVVAGLAGYFLSDLFTATPFNPIRGRANYSGQGTVVLIAGAIGGGVGYYRAKAKAFALRLQAELAMCQVQIEDNTRTDKVAAKPKEEDRAPAAGGFAARQPSS